MNIPAGDEFEIPLDHFREAHQLQIEIKTHILHLSRPEYQHQYIGDITRAKIIVHGFQNILKSRHLFAWYYETLLPTYHTKLTRIIETHNS